MKPSIILVALCFVCTSAFAEKYVRGHIRKDGSYVQGHVRSSPNNKRYDNLNSKTRGANPYTGKKGRQRDEFSSPPAYNSGGRK